MKYYLNQERFKRLIFLEAFNRRIQNSTVDRFLLPNRMGKTRKLKGGKYKYAGTYGCTYFPAMKCKGDLQRTPFSISKIMAKDHAIAEYQKQSLLKKKS